MRAGVDRGASVRPDLDAPIEVDPILGRLLAKASIERFGDHDELSAQQLDALLNQCPDITARIQAKLLIYRSGLWPRDLPT